MAATVTAAFSQFLANTVNLDSDQVARARTSRDWLITHLDRFPDVYDDFPTLYTDVHLHYGSFARRTKIRELDDVDILIGVSALGTTYLETRGRIELTVPDGLVLRGLCHDDSNLLNSRRVINRFVKHLGDVPQYQKAEIKRNGAAAVLNLTSYPWSFDIVPAFFTKPEWDGRTYYIIPDGSGHWMKTDPRIDQERVTVINQKHDGNVLNVIRIVKYWNARPTMPSMPSYLIETLVLAFFDAQLSKASAFVDLELPNVFSHIAASVHASVTDPKGIQGDINTLTADERIAIWARARADAAKAARARELERADDHRASIAEWAKVFGAAFPQYG